ncbi:phenylacetate--CoA ligase family protein [Rhodanobacter sp. MP7CTX1]|uniref:phenylacetate--CoA ligase family protein n=1 Tax=Rhodanobacter sp. MP7CTX1 TaxID=2723084 RepID=UPI00161E46CF|nr:phenylacetate--CoA ligase family protein [Rhodanobacter sp. MP7CTX1]MBB6188318.1 phenylacetate-CoA ligase [Rhodanobacter sp. MP7CTX1]
MAGWYETAFRHVLYPIYESGLRRRRTLAYLNEYRRNQWLAPEQIAALQWERLQRLLEHCEREVPFYQRRWRELGITSADIRNLDDYAQLPVLTKADIRAHADELTADSWRDRLQFKATGGSTGEPLRFGFTRESNDRRTAVMWRGYEWAGSRMGRRTLFLWGGAVGEPTRAHQFKDRLYNAAFARRVLNSFSMTEANMSSFADAIDAYRPDVIVAYVGPLVRLAQWLIATGRRIYRPQTIIGAAEALHEFQRQIIEQAFGCPAYNTYGCREFMLIAAECEQRDGLHVNADHLLVELRKPGSAASSHADDPHAAGTCTGEVVITDLFNYGMPFVRYVNGDVATATSSTCGCGRGLPLLRRVDGRVLDAIRTPAGHILPGEFFPHMLKDVAGLERFQVVQRRLDQLELVMVRGPGFDESSLAYIRREVAKVVGDSIELRCEFVDDIPLTPSGKLRVTVSQLPSSVA